MCWKLYTLSDLSNKICVPNKTEDLNLRVFNMIAGINESKKLTKNNHANVNVNLKEENVIQINIIIMIIVDVFVKNICEKDYIWNPTSCSCKSLNN